MVGEQGEYIVAVGDAPQDSGRAGASQRREHGFGPRLAAIARPGEKLPARHRAHGHEQPAVGQLADRWLVDVLTALLLVRQFGVGHVPTDLPGSAVIVAEQGIRPANTVDVLPHRQHDAAAFQSQKARVVGLVDIAVVGRDRLAGRPGLAVVAAAAQHHAPGFHLRRLVGVNDE